jgi:tRNA pseudouridine65 synthase
MIELVHSSPTWGVLNKAPGISCHNENGADVLSLLLQQVKIPAGQTFHLVNRLDKETSGLMVYATDGEKAMELQTALQQTKTVKKYLCVVRGKVKDNSIWNLPLSDKAEGRKNPQGLFNDRKPCETHMQIVKQNSYFSLIECVLGTGRTHQIRKHAALAKHAVVGDTRYGDPNYNKKISSIYKTDRLFLHSYQLTLELKSKVLHFEAPLPSEFNELFSSN